MDVTPKFFDTRLASEAVFIAEINCIWDVIPEATLESVGRVGNRGEPKFVGHYAVLECTIRTILEKQTSYGKPVVGQPEQGDRVFLWINLSHFEGDVAAVLEILTPLESVAVWGIWESLTFDSETSTYATLKQKYVDVGQKYEITVEPVLRVGLGAWKMIPLTNGYVDVTPVETLMDLLGDFRMFDLSKAAPSYGQYFADGDTESAFIAAVERFESEQNAGKNWLNPSEQLVPEKPENVWIELLGIAMLGVVALVTLMVVCRRWPYR